MFSPHFYKDIILSLPFYNIIIKCQILFQFIST